VLVIYEFDARAALRHRQGRFRTVVFLVAAIVAVGTMLVVRLRDRH
jgi:hypothetical protein